jgi:transposase
LDPLAAGDGVWVESIYRHLHHGLIAGNFLQADETPIRCNDPDHDRGKTLQCYLWVISRPKSDVVFAWRESRRHDELTPLLTDFKGVLQSDACGAYASHERKNEDIMRVGCWAHARRYFHAARDRHRKPAEPVLRLISRLYRLEAEGDEASCQRIEHSSVFAAGTDQVRHVRRSPRSQ